MHLGKYAYYADFVIYPLLLLACGTMVLWPADDTHRLIWFLAATGGLGLWTLLEYATHRLVLHRVAVFERMHDAHHQAPRALIGTPSWGTLSVALFVIFAPSSLLLGVFLGSAVTSGILVGYLWYSCVHHAVHQWQISPGSYLYSAKLRHAQHHFADQASNYGVTTSVWDIAFGSIQTPKRRRVEAVD